MQGRTIVGKPWWWLAAIVAAYLVLAIAAGRTNMPWCDEAWFATPGFNLAADGSFGTPVLSESAAWGGRNLHGINRITYWVMPLHPVLIAAWTHLAGANLYAVRALSLIWGLAALTGWFLIVRKLADPEGTRPALFMAGFLALDFQFVWYAGEGRMDMMTEALIAAAFAAFLWLRERNFTRAVLISQSFMMLAGMTHPISLGGFTGLLFLTLYLDWRKVRWQHLAVAAVPYLIGGAAWGLFISRDPAIFWDQFHGNLAGRFSREGGWLSAVWQQFRERFLWMYGFHPENGGASHLKILIFLIYAGAFVMGWAMRDFRGNRMFRAWLIACLVMQVAYWNLDKNVQEFYLVHITAPLIATAALVLDWLLRTRRTPAWAIAGVVFALCSVQLMTAVSRIRQDAYHKRYLDAIAFLKQNTRRDQLIIGSTELGWELGWKSNLVDDYRLGYLSGKKPDVIVVDKNRYQDWISKLKNTEPAAYRFATGLLEHDFRPVHRNEAYTIYFRATPANP